MRWSRREADRSTVIIAVGGGVIGDVVGFAAATYLRGVPVVHVPTTLLAQVDSAIGGKTGVNHPLGKNLIGAFHAPSLVVADPVVLETLPRREFRAGLYEVIKYGVIAEPALLDRMRDTLPAIFNRDGDAVAPLVAASCRIKAAVVSADERESGLRRILNFGHTIGHALEAVTKYKRFRHGEAIGYGMLAALAIGVARGITPKSLGEEVDALITQLGPLPSVADISAKEVLAAIKRDKKVVNGTLHFIAAADRGKTVEVTDVSEKEIKTAREEDRPADLVEPVLPQLGGQRLEVDLREYRRRGPCRCWPASCASAILRFSASVAKRADTSASEPDQSS